MAVVPEIVPQTDLDTGNHATQQIQQSSNSGRNQGQPSGGLQSDSTGLENHRGVAPLKSLEPGQGDMKQSTSGCPLDHNTQNDVGKTNLNLKETFVLEGEPIDLTVPDKSFGHVDLLNEDTQLDEDLHGTSEIVKATVVEAVGAPEPVIRVTDPVIEELVVRIRMAHGLQCLDMTQNGLSVEVVKQLWEAWCDGWRTGKKELLGKAHFAVQDGRECSALITSCVSCQPRT